MARPVSTLPIIVVSQYGARGAVPAGKTTRLAVYADGEWHYSAVNGEHTSGRLGAGQAGQMFAELKQLQESWPTFEMSRHWPQEEVVLQTSDKTVSRTVPLYERTNDVEGRQGAATRRALEKVLLRYFSATTVQVTPIEQPSFPPR